ncbi:MAG: hypothetical protein OXU81_09585 [Gammaproteobacteria bacterium]|nr:hypothetical protein [Gammaproteobacteria bacterium]
MDMDSWATLARLAEEAKADLEAIGSKAQAEIDACETVMALAEGAVRDGTWTSDPSVLAGWLDRAKRVAVAVCNGRELEDYMYLPLDGADEPQAILTGWLAQAPEGVGREAQVRYGNNGEQTESAFVRLRERSVRVVDTAEAQEHA